MSGKVFLVGAGPGAPDLITLRAAGALRSADVVVYDFLAGPEILKFAPAAAERIYAGKRGGGERAAEQSEINHILIEQARAGRRVVRLKGGDPFIFGRGGEECEALRAAGIDYEIIPGVTSAIAAPAFAGIPLTHRERGSFVVFATGHQDAARHDESAVPWETLAQAARGRGTIVILMATARMREILARMAAGGMPPQTPAAAIQWGATAAQRTVFGSIATLADEAGRAGIGAPAVIVVGECAALGRELAWVERMPLFGRRILVTRAAERAGEFAARLRALGAEAIEFAAIASAPPSSHDALDRAIAEIETFDWIIFTSAQGVSSFFARMRERERDIRAMSRAALAAIGPATAARLGDYALKVAATPREYRAEALIEAIGAARIAGARILIPRAETAREVLPETLRKLGAREVVVAPAYRTIRPHPDESERIAAMLEDGAIDLAAFTSSSTVENFVALVGAGAARRTKAAVIGPITAATARAHGLEIAVEAAQYTIDGLTEAIAGWCAGAPRR